MDEVTDEAVAREVVPPMTPRTEFGRLWVEWQHTKVGSAVVLKNFLARFTLAELDVLGDAAERIRAGRDSGQPYDPDARIAELERIVDQKHEEMMRRGDMLQAAEAENARLRFALRQSGYEAEWSRVPGEATITICRLCSFAWGQGEAEEHDRNCVLGAIPPPCAEHAHYVTILRCTDCGHETTPMAVRG